MPRRNRPTTRRPQSIKHAVEDRVARRAVANACEESYRHLPEVTYQGGRVTRITFTDPSYA